MQDPNILLSVSGHTIKFCAGLRNADSWLDTYSIRLEALGLVAEAQVDNPPYGADPSEFFNDLADNWKGWRGEKRWESLEGEFSLIAATDLSGHVSLTATLNSLGAHESWRSTTTLGLEAGQLDRIHRQISAFFGRLD